MKVMNKKPFLPERASVNLSQALDSIGDQVPRELDFSHFFLFNYPENEPNNQKSRKNVSKILKKVDRRKQGKTRKNATKSFRNAFRPLI